MVNTKLNAEVARLTRRTAEKQQLSFVKQAARCVAEQAIMDLDPELGFLVESDNSLASVDTIVRSAQVNDIVINGRHIDVCVADGNEVRLPAALLHTPYIECGSLVVQMADATSGTITGYIDEKGWESAEEPNQFEIRAKFSGNADFDLVACLQKIEKDHPSNVNKPTGKSSKGEEVLQFVRNARQMDIEAQRNVIAAALGSQQVRDSIAALDNYTTDESSNVLRDSSTWEARVQRVSKRIQDKFPGLNLNDIQKQVREVGAAMGGQPDAPAFREALSKRVAKLQFAHKASAAVRDILSPFIDSVAAGKNAAEAIKGFVKDMVAVDVARVIKEKRTSLGQLANATADEIGFAFQQLALQPAYATHSSSEGGIDAINEALELYEAAAVVESLMEIDFE